jgi:hypothetical protein
VTLSSTPPAVIESARANPGETKKATRRIMQLLAIFSMGSPLSDNTAVTPVAKTFRETPNDIFHEPRLARELRETHRQRRSVKRFI